MLHIINYTASHLQIASTARREGGREEAIPVERREVHVYTCTFLITPQVC